MTKVIFRKDRKSDNVIALFPDYTTPIGSYCMSYEHIGQHGECTYSYMISLTVPAKPEEYAELLAELQQIGYDDLVIRKRRSK